MRKWHKHAAFVEVEKFTSLHRSELPSDADFTNGKVVGRTFFSEAIVLRNALRTG
jgi:hypothetical protein